eukprot:266162_1
MTPGKAGGTQVRCNRQLEAIRHFRQEDRLHEILNGIELAKERRGKFNGKMLSAVLFELQSQAAEATVLDAAAEGGATLVVKPLDGKTLGAAIFDFKTMVLANQAAEAPTDKNMTEAAFHQVLDTLSGEEVQAAMLLFASTYTTPTPVPVATKRK